MKICRGVGTNHNLKNRKEKKMKYGVGIDISKVTGLNIDQIKELESN